MTQGGDPHRAELHASGFRAILEVGTEILGRPAVEEIVRNLGVELKELSDPNGWFSLEFAEALIETISTRADDPTWLDRAMRLGVTPKYLGILYPLFRAFGTPAFTYRQTVSIVQRLNKTMAWRLEELGSNYARFRVEPAPGVPRERTPAMCRVRMIQAEALATLFDLPPAVVTQPECLHRGDKACVYEVRWKEHRRPLWSLGGIIVGGSAAVATTALTGTSLPLVLLGGAVGAIGGWAVGRVREIKRDVRDRMNDLNESHDALTRSNQANEQRYAELLEAKTAVDKQVERRTAELREASNRLSQTLTEIQALDRAKTDFFNNVSHELRSPLTMILAPLEDLVAGRTPPSGNKTALEGMHRNATRLLRLINQLLDLAKIDAGEMKVALSPTELPVLVHGLLSGFEAAAAQKRVSLSFAAPENMPSIAIDPAWIESALTNLVANALRVSRPGGSVKIAIEDRGSEVTLAVADDGPGIAPEDQQKVFERFAQGDSSKRVIGGTGIGLALVREAVRLHGGDVKLESELGKGATFTLTLPRRADVKVTGEAPALSLRPAPRVIVDEFREDTQVISRPGPTPNAPLALVVEDNPELREFIADVLAVRYRVETAIHGKQALELASDLRPDVIVSDVAMPEMDGYELARAVRANEAIKSTPLLLVTARTETASILEGFDAGASDYILKPFHGRELLARVEVHVRLRRMMQEFAQRERHAMLGVLAASVAHQVRNPLTTLVSGLPAMRTKLDGKVSDSTRALMDVMIDCAGRIERLTMDLMDLSRIDREEGGEFKPSDGLRAAVRLVKARLPTSLELDEHIEDSPPLDGRPGDMNHVFLNVLDNASRAVGESGRICVHASVQGPNYVIRIGDSGPGIDAETAQRIFEPFFTTRPAGEGTGLGLAIARQVTQQSGGTIEVGRSELGGAEFTIQIPLTRRRTLRPLSHPPPPSA